MKRYCSCQSAIIIALIVIIFVIILYTVYLNHRRRYMYGEIEGFVTSNTNDDVTIQSSLSSRSQMPLAMYCIKAAYNCSYDGMNITLAALDRVLARGCRFLDFEIYMIDGAACVGYSPDSSYSGISKSGTLPILEVMNEVANNCFTNNTPNPRDPMFLNLRIKTSCGEKSSSSSCAVYASVAAAIKDAFGDVLYLGPEGKPVRVNGGTILSDIGSKVIVALDVGLSADYNNYARCEEGDEKCYDLRDVVNVETGGVWRRYYYSDLIQRKQTPLIVDPNNPMEAEPSSGTLVLSLAMPNSGLNVSSPSSPIDYIANYGCQTVPYKFYVTSKGLREYEEMFNKYKTAFLPVGYAISYSNNK